MGEARRRNEQARQRVEIVDSLTESPTIRAVKVLDILKEHSNLNQYDLVCFSVSYLFSQVHILPWMSDVAKNAMKLLTQFHYWYGYKINLYPENLNGIQVKQESNQADATVLGSDGGGE